MIKNWFLIKIDHLPEENPSLMFFVTPTRSSLSAFPGLDPCAMGHDCEHICVNSNASYYCNCWEGFVLNEDMKTCSKKSKLSPGAMITGAGGCLVFHKIFNYLHIKNNVEWVRKKDAFFISRTWGKSMLRPMSTVRAMLKKLKATATVTNLRGRGPMFILPPHTAP